MLHGLSYEYVVGHERASRGEVTRGWKKQHNEELDKFLLLAKYQNDPVK
jgi:hypothetical protein